MRILITGGCGFLGSHLADRLLANGDEVLVIDNFATGRRDNLSPQERLRISEGTIADEAFVRAEFESFKPEVVVHAAASYKDPENWREDAATNVIGTVHVVKSAQAVKAKRLIYFQTALCYGLRPLEQPITLKHPIDARGTSYAISKTAGEHYVEMSGLDYVSFRLANAYGPRNISGPLPTFFQRLNNNQKCFVMDTRRDFIFVNDLIDVVHKAVSGTGKGVYHISSGRDFSIQELFDEVVAALAIKLQAPVEVRPRSADDAPSILLDPSRTEVDFGWKARTPLRDGIRAAVEYYKKFGIAETYTHLKLKSANESN